MNWHNLVIFRQHGMATSLGYNKVFLTGKPLRLRRPAPRRRGCAFLFLQYFHAYQIKNWPKPERWTGGVLAAAYLGSDALARQAHEPQKKKTWVLTSFSKEKVIRFCFHKRDIICVKIRKSFVFLSICATLIRPGWQITAFYVVVDVGCCKLRDKIAEIIKTTSSQSHRTQGPHGLK